jgi:hypothetical protein
MIRLPNSTNHQHEHERIIPRCEIPSDATDKTESSAQLDRYRFDPVDDSAW